MDDERDPLRDARPVRRIRFRPPPTMYNGDTLEIDYSTGTARVRRRDGSVETVEMESSDT